MLNFLTRRGLISVVLVLALTTTALAQGLPSAPPESVGMSAARLKRLSAAMQRAVDQERAAGIVTLVARKGKIAHFESFGQLDREKQIPMPKNALFRIASMSKAITTVAIVMLMEEGAILLDDPVSKFIPAFKKTTVLAPTAGAGAEVASVPARREITIRDLLTQTAGLSYGTGPLEAQYKAANVHMWYFADKDEPIATTIERLATLPHASQPGERYIYGFATDVLGVVVEKASGLSLDEFFRTRIFEPLKMMDSSFYVPAAKASRLATVYGYGSGGLKRAPDGGREGQGEYVTGPRKAFSGGAGVISTAHDYARFLQMLLERRRARGRATARAEVDRADDVQQRRFALPGRTLRVWVRLRNRRTRGPEWTAGFCRRVLLGRRVLHEVLGRSGRASRRRVHDTASALGRPSTPGSVPHPRQPGDRPE